MSVKVQDTSKIDVVLTLKSCACLHVMKRQVL